jgi:hypothetical protein
LQVLLQQATTTQQLQLVEQHLVTAVNSAQQLSQVDKGLLLDANAVCRAEAAAGEVARGRLALLLCQQGRGPEADEHLVALGFCYRLSDEVRLGGWVAGWVGRVCVQTVTGKTAPGPGPCQLVLPCSNCYVCHSPAYHVRFCVCTVACC